MENKVERNEVASRIESMFMVGGVWIVTREEEHLYRHLKEAVDEIDRLQAEIDDFGASLDEAIRDKEDQLDQEIKKWLEHYKIVDQNGRKLRNAAQSFVTQFDRVTFKTE